jgi:RNA 2'-O ribose methyltransferase substrate binding
MPAAAATGRPIAPRLWLSVPVTVARCGPSHTGAGQTGRVADVIAVSDPSDPRLTDFVRLTDVGLRTSLEAAHGLFVAEGEKVIRRAIGAGYQVRSLLVTPDRLATLPGLAADGPAPVYLVPPEVAERITGYRVHRGAGVDGPAAAARRRRRGGRAGPDPGAGGSGRPRQRRGYLPVAAAVACAELRRGAG